MERRDLRNALTAYAREYAERRANGSPFKPGQFVRQRAAVGTTELSGHLLVVIESRTTDPEWGANYNGDVGARLDLRVAFFAGGTIRRRWVESVDFQIEK